MGLEAGDPLQSARQRAPIPLQEQLTSQQRPIERSGREDRLGHAESRNGPPGSTSALRVNVLEDFVERRHEIVGNFLDAMFAAVIREELVARVELR